jgi:hypothetical protein
MKEGCYLETSKSSLGLDIIYMQSLYTTKSKQRQIDYDMVWHTRVERNTQEGKHGMKYNMAM